MLKRRIALVALTIGVVCTILGIVGYATNNQVPTASLMVPGLLGLIVGTVVLWMKAWGSKRP